MNHTGLYDTQYEGRSEPDCRGRLTTDKDGKYCYRAVLPVAYPIPNDGQLFCLKCHCWLKTDSIFD